MKQIIHKYDDGSIRYKTNYINDKEIGLEKWYDNNNNNKPYKIKYHL